MTQTTRESGHLIIKIHPHLMALSPQDATRTHAAMRCAPSPQPSTVSSLPTFACTTIAPPHARRAARNARIRLYTQRRPLAGYASYWLRVDGFIFSLPPLAPLAARFSWPLACPPAVPNLPGLRKETDRMLSRAYKKTAKVNNLTWSQYAQ